MNRIFVLFLGIVFSLNTSAQKIHLKKEAEGYWIMDNEKKVFFFQRHNNDSIPSYARNNYFHPVYDLNGNCITEDFPEDHLHHRGIFWAWREVLVDGVEICDPWEITNFSQNISQFEFYVSNEKNGVIKYSSYWHSNDKPDDPFLRENTKVTIHPVSGNHRRIDFEITFRALEKNLMIGGSDDAKGYGGFTVRMKTDENTVFTAPDKSKITPTNLAIPAGQYVDISNPKKKNGVTIISWPQNPGEEQWILRQSGSAQNCAWPGRNPVEFSITEPTILKYTVLIHHGKRNKVPIERILKELK